MSHQLLLWTLQSSWEAAMIFLPVVLLTAVTWRLSK
jgi:hypothetical protein